jgi:hypothetical protein
MSYVEGRHCVRCGNPEEDVLLDRCVACGKYFCADCAYRATGRRFCSAECARAFFYGEGDDYESDDSADA